MFNPNHDELNPVIDRLMLSAAHALKTGKVTEEDIQRALVEDRQMDPGEAANLARAARILSSAL